MLRGRDAALSPAAATSRVRSGQGASARCRPGQSDDVLDLVRYRGVPRGPTTRGAAAGQLQLIALAVAMAGARGVAGRQPSSALDHGAREHVLTALLRVNAHRGTTIVVVTP